MAKKKAPLIETNGVHDVLDNILKLTRAEVMEAAGFGREQAAALVGLYYGIQKSRIGASNKISAHNREVDILADSALIMRLKEALHTLEKETARGLKSFAESQPLGRWCMSIGGIGPVVAAGLLAHIDLNKAKTAGAIWRFAGIDPTMKWNTGEKRPWNAHLKRLCFIIGESFKKVTLADKTDDQMGALTDKQKKIREVRSETFNSEAGLYARLYAQRKQREVERNESGQMRGAAMIKLEEARAKKRKIPKELREIWESGKLPPGGLDRRAARYAVSIFLSHYHTVGRDILGLPLVKPWVIEHGGHVDYIPPPLWNAQIKAQLMSVRS